MMRIWKNNDKGTPKEAYQKVLTTPMCVQTRKNHFSFGIQTKNQHALSPGDRGDHEMRNESNESTKFTWHRGMGLQTHRAVLTVTSRFVITRSFEEERPLVFPSSLPLAQAPLVEPWRAA